MKDLDLIDRRIAELKTELTDLETAARVLRKLGASPPGPRGRAKVLPRRRMAHRSRLTITEAAKTILSELNGNAEHYAQIAKRAVEMGYEARSTSTPDKSVKAFWATMKRRPEIFESMGEGRFKLKE